MAATTVDFEAELLAGGFGLRDRGLMQGANAKLRRVYLDGVADAAAHTLAKNNAAQVEALTRCGKLASFDAITGPGTPPLPGSLAALPRISRGLPVQASNDFGGINAAANAVDGNYGTSWRSVTSPNGGTAQWLAVDLRTVAAGDKTTVLAVIKGPTMPTFVPAPAALGSNGASQYTSMIRNGTLDKHLGGAGGLPADNDAGWVNLATFTDNRWAHLVRSVDLHDANWFRVRATAANGVTGATDDINLQLDLVNAAPAAGGRLDWFVIFGDSITAEGTRGRNVDNTAWPAGEGPLENMLETLTGRPTPIIVDASTAGWRADLAAPAVATYVGPFAGAGYGYITYGANDVNAAGADLTGSGGVNSAYAQTFKTNMQTIIDYMAGLGMIAVLPHILNGNLNAWTAPNRGYLNTIIDQLVAANPTKAIAGPDMTSFPLGELRDGLHPKYDTPGQGYSTWHTLYVNAIADLY